LSEAQDHYNFHLIFRGLFRCVPDRENGQLSVLLVDARSPQRSRATGEPLRDHRAVIEFSLKDWRNRTSEPLNGLIEVNKHVKGATGIYLLSKQDIQIGVNRGQFSPDLTFIEDDSETSFRRLPRLEKITPGSGRVLNEALTSGTSCIARVLNLKHGEVRSERTSMLGEQRLQWAFSRPRERSAIKRLMESNDPERIALAKELLTAGEINLDVRVTTRVPTGASVLINPNPFPNNGLALDPPAFMLRPDDGKDLKVWVKNRELEAVLAESDELNDKQGCLEEDLADLDFELHYELSTEAKNLRIPYRGDMLSEDTPVSAGGCACGGCTGG
jgi:hypothetical protein